MYLKRIFYNITIITPSNYAQWHFHKKFYCLVRHSGRTGGDRLKSLSVIQAPPDPYNSFVFLLNYFVMTGQPLIFCKGFISKNENIHSNV
jgi:hypothetical protein